MRYRGHFERITAFKLVIILVSLLVIIGLPTHPQKESLANTGSSSPVNYPKSKTGDLDSAQTPNPHSQFAAEVGKVVDTLTRIEETLVLGQNPHQEFTYLLHSKQTIKKLNDTILGNFISVRQHCEQFALGEEILNRCAISLDNYTTTEKIVIESITAVLEAKKPVKDKERTPKENHSQSNTGAMNLGVELANSDTLLAIVTDSLEVLQTLKLKCEPDLHNSRPSVWEVQTAELDPGEFFDPTAPSVNVMAEAAATPPVPADLAENIDVQITDEIIDKAEELAYSASAIYEFVRNECEFQPYFGSRKGSVEALRQRSGNDYDLASLAIALLRASGIEARYATGIVEIPVDRANSWLGVDDGQVASSILYTMGLEGMSMVDGGGQVVAVRCRRVWVETYVSRGRGGGMVWVPLDPAFSLNDIHYGIDIPADMGLDAQAFIEEYYDPTDPAVILPRAETPLELLKQDISDYLAVNEPNKTVETVKRTQEIVPENLGLLPASLPYKVLSRDASFSEIPADKVYQIRFHLRDGGTTLIDETFDLPEIAGKRVTISYVGATPTDQATIDSYGGIYQTPPYLVHLKPVLRVDGAEVAIGTVGVPMGLSHSSDIHFLAPTNDGGLPNNVVPAIYNTMTCGAAVAIAFCTSDVSENLLQDPPEDDTEGTAQLLYSTAVDYLAMCHNADQEIGSLMHCFVIQDLADAIVENVVNVTFSGGTPQTFEWVSMRVDADRSVLAIWPVDGIDYSQTTDLMILGGSEGSVYEHVIFEDSYEQEAVSTIKILELAADEGITIYKRWDHLPLPANTLSSSARAAIEKAISIHGHVVTFPAAEITAGTPETGEWTGTGWIDMDPASGAAGYIISGNNNGGVTVDSWPPEFVDLSKGDLSVTRVEISIDDPSADSPDGSAIFPRIQSGFLGFGRTSKKITFKYRLHVFYDDGSDVWLPKPILGVTRHYKRTTHYTAKQFAPGHYMFKIWVSRWLFWETLATAERKVSIVGVFIRKDNGSPLGTDPPKYLPVKPATGSVPAETFKAVIIPSDLSGSGSYSWSTGWWFPKLSIKSPSSQITDVEPAGSNPSGSVDAEELDVTFTPSGGPECLTDDPHKMTVYKIDLTASDLGGTLAESSEESPGAFIHFNLDNDNSSNNALGSPKHPGADYLETTNTVSGEDDLKSLAMSLSPSLEVGTVTLSIPSLVKVWKSTTKGSANLILGNGSKSWDLSNVGQRNELRSLCSSSIYVEGVNTGSGNVILTHRGICTVNPKDIVKFTFIAANCGDQPKTSTSPSQRSDFESAFPNLKRCEWSITENIRTNNYNCIAWTVDDTTHWWNKISSVPGTNYKGIDQEYGNPTDGNFDMNDLDNFYLVKKGYKPIATGPTDAKVMYYSEYHGAKKNMCGCGSGKWIMFESKCGGWERIEHNWDQLNGTTYGTPIRFYK